MTYIVPLINVCYDRNKLEEPLGAENGVVRLSSNVELTMRGSRIQAGARLVEERRARGHVVAINLLWTESPPPDNGDSLTSFSIFTVQTQTWKLS